MLQGSKDLEAKRWGWGQGELVERKPNSRNIPCWLARKAEGVGVGPLNSVPMGRSQRVALPAVHVAIDSPFWSPQQWSRLCCRVPRTSQAKRRAWGQGGLAERKPSSRYTSHWSRLCFRLPRNSQVKRQALGQGGLGERIKYILNIFIENFLKIFIVAANIHFSNFFLQLYLALCMGTWDSNSAPHECTASDLTHRTISSAPKYCPKLFHHNSYFVKICLN